MTNQIDSEKNTDKPEFPKRYTRFEGERIHRDPDTYFPKNQPGLYYKKKFKIIYCWLSAITGAIIVLLTSMLF